MGGGKQPSLWGSRVPQLLCILASAQGGAVHFAPSIALVGWGLFAAAGLLGRGRILPSIEGCGSCRGGDVVFVGGQAPLVSGTRGIEVAVSRCCALVRHVSAKTGLPNGWHLERTQKSQQWCITKEKALPNLMLRLVNKCIYYLILN